MQHTNQYFFSKEKLIALIKKFDNPPGNVVNNKHFKGIVFTPGYDPNGDPAVFAFPMFCGGKAGSDGDYLIQHTDAALSGCPYPPPCINKEIHKGCYE